MELVVPSLVALLLGIAITFFVLPRLAPTILITGSAVVLGAALYLHYSRFGRMEYDQSTWQNNLKQFGSWIMVGAVLLGAYGFYAMNSGQLAGITPAMLSSSASSNSVMGGEMPAFALPQAGGGFKIIARTAASRINSLLSSGRINI